VSATPVQVELEVDPVEVTPTTIDLATVKGAVTNRGGDTIDTRVRHSELRVNGELLQTWGLAIGNGSRDEREYALPPGERVEFARVLGRELFDGPGDYEVVLNVLGVDSDPARVTLVAA
jgi:hypothetical protein